MPYRTVLLFKAAVFSVTLICSHAAFAQMSANRQYLSALSPDVRSKHVVNGASLSLIRLTKDSVGDLNTDGDNKRLLTYLQELGLPDEQYRYQSNKKFYYHLANTFARLKLYPLAMKCFLKAVKVNGMSRDISQSRDTALNATGSLSFALSSKDDSIVNKQAVILKHKHKERKSRPTSFDQIINNFNDGKTAVAYALLFHVKQPAPGKRKIFVWVNTGHTFITLIKYNSDSTYSSASFGFYPEKDHLLSASPIFPSTSATFKDDADHRWDEVLGKFITRRRFERILKLTRDFEGLQYNLNQRNCTDFGLQAADLAGIHIGDTVGKWPLGKGNNPAVTGQSILHKMVLNDEGELFRDDTVVHP